MAFVSHNLSFSFVIWFLSLANIHTLHLEAAWPTLCPNVDVQNNTNLHLPCSIINVMLILEHGINLLIAVFVIIINDSIIKRLYSTHYLQTKLSWLLRGLTFYVCLTHRSLCTTNEQMIQYR